MIPETNRAYIDECGINEVLMREYGYAPRGKRVEDTKRGRKFHRLNIVGGLFRGRVVAPHCYEHSTNGVFFEWWFETQFLPNVSRGTVVFLDNASFHRRAQLFALAVRAGVFLVFLPAYSPDYNGIEKWWANMKAALIDLVPKCGTLQEAVYTHFERHNY